MTFPQSRILCVDNDMDTCDWIETVLHSSNVYADITTARTGREAFTMLNENRFDLCILEYALPDMTGAQLCSLVRQMGNHVPMMFFSALDRSIDKERAAAAGANEYLYKPEDLDMFAHSVRSLLTKGRRIHLETTRLLVLPKAA